MNKMQIYWQLCIADFRERTRRSGFLVMMLGILFFGYLVITGKYTVKFGEYRTIYDATWAGTLMAVCGSIILTIVGFYLVRGSIKRDRNTEVGQIIAATQMTKRSYIISRFFSNFMVLMFLTGVLALTAFLTLLIRNEAAGIGFGAFLLPFVTISLPAMTFVAAAAILFDTVKWLRGSIGNVIYLFAAEACLVMGMLGNPFLDLGAATLFSESVRSAASAAFPGETIPLIMGFVMFDPEMQVEAVKIIPWDGIEWSAITLQLRLFWFAAAVPIVAISIPFFDRFDPALASRKQRPKKKKKQKASPPQPEMRGVKSDLTYSELVSPPPRFSLLRMTMAELRLAVKGYHWFWYLVAIGAWASQIAAPLEVARQYLTPLAMVWPLAMWSSMGTRESQHDTDPLLFSSPEPVRRQLPAIWMSGLVVSLAAQIPMVFRAAIIGHPAYAATLLTAALLVPSAALAFGILSKSRRLFEVLYLMFWYVGSIEHFAAIDLLGTTDAAISAGKFITLGSLSLLFVLSAFLTRKARVSGV